MEKGGQKAATMFLEALVKSVQSLCHGYLEFQDGIEIMGFINLSVDKENSVDCVLKEKVCKTGENATSFISNSYHAKPAPEESGNGGPAGSQTGSGGNTSSKKANSDLRDSEFSSTSRVSLKRKAQEDLSDDGSSKKPTSHRPHSSSKTSRSQVSISASEAACVESSSGRGQTTEDIDQVKLTGSGIVLERVNENCGGDDSNDFDVTFIKEEYVEEDNAACDFDGSADQHLAGDQFNGRGQNPSAAYGLMSAVSSMDPTSSFKAEPAEQDNQGSASSFQLHPPSSGMRGGTSWTEGPHVRHDAHSSSAADSFRQLCMDFGPSSAASSCADLHPGAARDKLFHCVYCPATFATNSGLWKHKNIIHFNKKETHVCKFCGKGFLDKTHYVDHLNVHLNIREHQCAFCPHRFTHKASLKLHVKSKHGKR